MGYNPHGLWVILRVGYIRPNPDDRINNNIINMCVKVKLVVSINKHSNVYWKNKGLLMPQTLKKYSVYHKLWTQAGQLIRNSWNYSHCSGFGQIPHERDVAIFSTGTYNPQGLCFTKWVSLKYLWKSPKKKKKLQIQLFGCKVGYFLYGQGFPTHTFRKHLNISIWLSPSA